MAVLIVGLYYLFGRTSVARSDADGSTSSSLGSSSQDSGGDSATDAGVSSGDWGSGHQAGYDWAEQHDIDDEGACETAGDSHNSPSFTEGCKAYVEEQGRP